jgi:hypothetical protein
MSDKSPPIKLSFAKILFRLLFDGIDLANVELTDHFESRMAKRKIDHLDILRTIENGKILKEYKPRLDRPSWRWDIAYESVTIIFTFDIEHKCFTFITCWRGKMPKGENP